METKIIVPKIKSAFDFQQSKILEDEKLKEDMLEDHNHIMKKLMFSSLYHIFYLSTYIFTMTYIVGLIWCILIGYANEYWFDENDDNFISNNDISLLPDLEKWINFGDQLTIYLYFAFTTLSTIGLGDYHATSTFERVVSCFIFLIGVAFFSYIMGILTEIINKFLKLDADQEESEQLQKFFSVIAYFNGNKELDSKIKDNIHNFMFQRWKCDR